MKTVLTLILMSLASGAFAAGKAEPVSISPYKTPNVDFDYSCQISVGEEGDCNYWKYVTIHNNNLSREGFVMRTEFSDGEWDYKAPGCANTPRQVERVDWSLAFQGDDKHKVGPLCSWKDGAHECSRDLEHVTIDTSVSMELAGGKPVTFSSANGGSSTQRHVFVTQTDLFYYGPKGESLSVEARVLCEQKKYAPKAD